MKNSKLIALTLSGAVMAAAGGCKQANEPQKDSAGNPADIFSREPAFAADVFTLDGYRYSDEQSAPATNIAQGATIHVPEWRWVEGRNEFQRHDRRRIDEPSCGLEHGGTINVVSVEQANPEILQAEYSAPKSVTGGTACPNGLRLVFPASAIAEWEQRYQAIEEQSRENASAIEQIVWKKSSVQQADDRHVGDVEIVQADNWIDVQKNPVAHFSAISKAKYFLEGGHSLSKENAARVLDAEKEGSCIARKGGTQTIAGFTVKKQPVFEYAEPENKVAEGTECPSHVLSSPAMHNIF